MWNRIDVDSAFASRQLRQVRAQIIAKDYPEVMWDRFVPLEPGVSPGADTFAHQEMDSVGEARITTNYANDVPMVDVLLTESANGIVGLTTGYEYNIQDLRKAQFSRMDVPARKGMAARDRLEYKLDELVATGASGYGVSGFINHSSVGQATVANPGGGTEWTNKTADQRLEDIRLAITAIQEQTNGIEGNAVDVILPLEQYFLLSSAFLSGGQGINTALQFVQNAIPQVQSVSSWYRLKQAGAANADRMIVYSRDPDKVSAVVPIRLNTMPEERNGFSWRTFLEARTGGCIFYKPKSAVYRDGI